MTKGLQLIRGAYGLALLLAPHLALQAVNGKPGDERVRVVTRRVVTRVLGARNVAEALFWGAIGLVTVYRLHGEQ